MSSDRYWPAFERALADGRRQLIVEGADIADVDAVEFEQLVNAADDSSADCARGYLEQARSLWDGRPYDEFADEPWAEVEARRLSELHTAAMEELVVILLDAGEEPPTSATALLGGMKILVPMAGLIDVAAERDLRVRFA